MRLLLFSLLAIVLLGGCASSDQTQNTNSTNGNVSTIPWNKPQSWEAGGALGSAMGQ